MSAPFRDKWDAESNLRAHGLSFVAAVFAFGDPMSATREDPYPNEQRLRTTGMVGTQVVMVVHAWPDFDTETGEEIVLHHLRTLGDETREGV